MSADTITEAATSPSFIEPSNASKDEGCMCPPSTVSHKSSRHVASKPTMDVQEEAPVQPKHCGHPPKAGKFCASLISFHLADLNHVLAPVIFKNSVIFNKNHFSKHSTLFSS